MKTKYTSPSLEVVEMQTEDVITASLVSEGKGSITVGDRTIEGEQGTFSSSLDNLLNGLLLQ